MQTVAWDSDKETYMMDGDLGKVVFVVKHDHHQGRLGKLLSVGESLMSDQAPTSVLFPWEDMK